MDDPRGKAYGLTESLTHKGKLVWQRIYLPTGYGDAKDGLFYEKTWWENLRGIDRKGAVGDILGLTTSSSKDIYLSKGAFTSKALFVDTITHETGHVILNNSKYFQLAETATRMMGKYSKPLDNLGHISIRKMSIELFKMNSWLKSPWYIPGKYFYNSNSTLDNLLKKLIKPLKF